MKNYEKILKVFFNRAEFDQIKRIGGLKANIEKTNKLFTNTQKELNKSFEGRLLDASPQEIFNKIYKPGNIGEIKTLKNILQKNPDIYKKFQRDVITDLNERVFTRSDRLSLDRVLDANAFNNLPSKDLFNSLDVCVKSLFVFSMFFCKPPILDILLYSASLKNVLNGFV